MSRHASKALARAGSALEARRRLRCAVYTRKSTEEGLDQAFNSLDAQREACLAYILSQAGESWVSIDTAYDDGGYSGGNMDRPALKRLLADIDAGRIDVVVVYKIDRLTRSLADFAKIVERLDARNASFVSVTQAFNTTTSMGRLTLNVLLSFAQFEREVGAERVRDKIAASRKKGIWMGGSPALGYDVRDRKLVPNEAEADAVRWMFQRYLELKSLKKLRAEIEQRGIRTKTYVSRSGHQRGGKHWYVGPLRHLLRNRVYIGDAVHRGVAWPGEHSPIVDAKLFEAVQAAFDASRSQRQASIRQSAGMLTGLVLDDAGNRMSPQLTSRARARRYGYYVSQAHLQGRDRRASLARVSIAKLDSLVGRVLEQCGACKTEGAVAPTHRAASDTSPAAESGSMRAFVHRCVVRVEVGSKRVVIVLDRKAVGLAPAERGADTQAQLPGCSISEKDDTLVLTIEIRVGPSSSSKKIDPGLPNWARPASNFDVTLVKNLVLAHRCRRSIELGNVASIEAAAKMMRLARNNARQILRLAWLAPDIQTAILDGRQPVRFDTKCALQTVIPAGWAEQHA